MTDGARDEAIVLLRALAKAAGDDGWSELEPAAFARITLGTELERWAASGAMDLTGDPDGAPAAPDAPVASRMVGAGAVLAAISSRLGREVCIDAPALLSQRAALRGLARQGDVSPGGGCRLLRTQDGWVAVSLNRRTDWELLPALFGIEAAGWRDVAASVADMSSDVVTTRAGELGLAIAVLPTDNGAADEQWRSRHSDRPGPWVITRGTGEHTGRAPARVLDLSALWAGPLCASLLRRAGADVVTLESTGRPDGARRGDPELHRLLHQGNSFVTVDLHDSVGVAELHRLVGHADLVVSSARMRALQQLALDPFDIVERSPGLTWVGISAYGLTGPWSNRIGYGDDAAVAGGLVIREPTPMFCADAIADPITGLYAAIAALALSASGGGVIDAALRDTAAHIARPLTAEASA